MLRLDVEHKVKQASLAGIQIAARYCHACHKLKDPTIQLQMHYAQNVLIRFICMHAQENETQTKPRNSACILHDPQVGRETISHLNFVKLRCPRAAKQPGHDKKLSTDLDQVLFRPSQDDWYAIASQREALDCCILYLNTTRLAFDLCDLVDQ
jgi:hypothetical protein